MGSTYLTKIDYLLSNQHIIETIPKKSTKTNITAQLKTLTIAQQSVYTQINISSKPTILYGITGSGKTEIYLQLVLQQLQKKKQVLILYPEINLTPMLRSRFDHAFPDTNIIILNSQVTNPKRLEYYQQIKDGHAQIIMGTRLSLFSPFCNLGLIIVDEEHDNSFKQEDNLPYHARNIAVWLANRYRIPIVLGSATPSLESLYNYKVGKYNLVKLETRATDNAILPKIELIDSTLLKPNNAGICYPTLQAIQECIDRKQMCLIYINRRGYAPVVICNECNHIIKCINCNCNMVLHGKNRLLCHYCGYQNTLPSQCPSCNQNSLSGIGTGTQNIEEFITTHFSNSNILRIDRDNTSSKHAWDDIYTKLNHHKVDIIIGTQMLAKGHDFANLSLVVCVDVDNALYSPSYNAITQMYSTLTQVSGRAGRADNKGRVIIQTRFPQEKIFSYLKAHDFLGWVNYILNERKQFHLPPYSHQAKIKFQSSNELDLATLHTHIMSRIIQHKTNKEIIVYSPVFDAMAKINNIYHSHMLIQSNLRGRLHNYLVTEMLPQLKLLNNKLYFKVDIDFIN